MKFFDLLLEGRREDFLKKYSRKFAKSDLDRIINDFKPKYYDWVGENLDPISIKSVYTNLVSSIKYFDKVSSNLKHTDIYSYKSVEQLFKELNEYNNRTRRNYEQVNGANIVYDDKKRFVVFNPLTHDSSCFYGSGTKWCTTSGNPSKFNEYNMDGKLFYILDRTKPTSDNFYKVAILKKYDGEISLFDAEDKPIKNGWILGTDEYENILSSIQNYLQTQFRDQLEIFSDKKRAELELKRLKNLEIRRRNAQKIRDAEERRANGEWDLDEDCPEIGLKAHALLSYLKEQRNIEDIEMDVYDLIPSGQHYECNTFEIVGVEEFSEETYSVCTEDEAYNTCYEYLEGLIDDIGYDGFRGMNLNYYISKQELRSFIEELYENDIYDNPEVYFSPEDMELSAYQENQIKEIDEKIEYLKKRHDELEMSDEDNEDELQELIDSIDELEEEKQTILDDPDGGISDEKVQEQVEMFYQDALGNVASFLEMHGMKESLNSLVDRKKFIDDVIEIDGYGMALSPYDGEYEEVRIKNNWFSIGRVD